MLQKGQEVGVLYRGLILDFGGVLTTRMKLNGEAFERAEGLRPGSYFHALEAHPDDVAVYEALEVGQATQEDWNRVIGSILGIDPTDLMRRALATELECVMSGLAGWRRQTQLAASRGGRSARMMFA
ncbi:hypothetical protein ACH40F_46890 [Streptomyces sp. NPDC020794]|uniref:hypothetical protein n=1 Tax=unclassified Streptomyces TaxID=2593676 RepID=UPI0036F00B19